jgi:hypothetical protein
VSADQHHVGFVGLLNNDSSIIYPDSNDRIQVTDDGIINADQLAPDKNTLVLSIDPSALSHGDLANIFDDDHTHYMLGQGRSGGQTLHGGTDDSDNLTLASTASGTVGSTYIGNPSIFEVDESTGQLKLPTTGSGAGILIGGDAQLYRSAENLLRTPVSLYVGNTLTGKTVEATGDTSLGDNAAMGYTATDGLVLTGQGSTNDVTIRNDQGQEILAVPTGAVVLSGPSGTWDLLGMDLASDDTYAINSTDVLTSTTLGSGVVTSSLTFVPHFIGATSRRPKS